MTAGRELTFAVLILALGGCATTIDTFSEGGLTAGVRMTEEACRAQPTSVWVVVDGTGDCIRYFIAGEVGPSRTAVIFLHGDHLAHYWTDRNFTVLKEVRTLNYVNKYPAAVQWAARQRAAEMGVPFVFVARPGVYGSSGDHKERRRPREVTLVDRALDAIKHHHGLERLILAGQSGGGHLVAALLARRADITCAVITSGNVAVEARNRARGWVRDVTGYTDFVDPMKEVDRISNTSGLRVFVVGDPDDTNVPFATQRAYWEALRARRVDAYLATAKGEGPERHFLEPMAYTVAAGCARNESTEDILSRVQ